MGRKRFGKRKHLLLCITGLIFFSLFSCSPIIERPSVVITAQPVIVEKECCVHTEVWESLAKLEDFETILKRTQDTLAALPKNRPADGLLFTLGLLYAHPENPRKNYKKSLAFFKRVINEDPRRVGIGEARVWAGVLEDIEKAAKVDLEIEQKKKELGK